MNDIKGFPTITKPLPIQEFLQGNTIFLNYFNENFFVTAYDKIGVEIFRILKRVFPNIKLLQSSYAQLTITDKTYVYKIALDETELETQDTEMIILLLLNSLHKPYAQKFIKREQYVLIEEFIPNPLKEWNKGIDIYLKYVIDAECLELGIDVIDVLEDVRQFRVRDDGTYVLVDWNECYLNR